MSLTGSVMHILNNGNYICNINQISLEKICDDFHLYRLGLILIQNKHTNQIYWCNIMKTPRHNVTYFAQYSEISICKQTFNCSISVINESPMQNIHECKYMKYEDVRLNHLIYMTSVKLYRSPTTFKIINYRRLWLQICKDKICQCESPIKIISGVDDIIKYISMFL